MEQILGFLILGGHILLFNGKLLEHLVGKTPENV